MTFSTFRRQTKSQIHTRQAAFTQILNHVLAGLLALITSMLYRVPHY